MDLKPQNLLLTEKGGFDSVQVIDFGSAKVQIENVDMTGLNGSPYYMAPEVINGAYDSKCDLWSLGVILFQLLTGTLPFKAKT